MDLMDVYYISSIYIYIQECAYIYIYLYIYIYIINTENDTIQIQSMIPSSLIKHGHSPIKMEVVALDNWENHD